SLASNRPPKPPATAAPCKKLRRDNMVLSPFHEVGAATLTRRAPQVVIPALGSTSLSVRRPSNPRGRQPPALRRTADKAEPPRCEAIRFPCFFPLHLFQRLLLIAAAF